MVLYLAESIEREIKEKQFFSVRVIEKIIKNSDFFN